MKKIIGQGPGERKAGNRFLIAAAVLSIALAVLALVLAGKTSSEKQVKARYDGQTYAKAASAGYDGHENGYSYSNGFADLMGGSVKNESAVTFAPEMAYEDAAMAGGAADYDDSYGYVESGSSGTAAPAHGKKIAYTYDYTVESTDYDAFMAELQEKLDGMGGYIEYSRLDRREHDRLDGGGTLSLRRGDYTLRAPADRMKEVIALFSSGSAQTTYENVRMTDKTAAYVDAQTQLASYQREYGRLEALLDEAESVSDTIAIQDRLSSLNYSIEWAKKQMQLIDEDVDFATLDLELYEVVYYTASIEAYRYGFGEELARAFRNFVYTIPEFLFVMIYLSVGILVAAGTGSAVVSMAVRRFRRKRGEQVIRIVDGRASEKGHGPDEK